MNRPFQLFLIVCVFLIVQGGQVFAQNVPDGILRTYDGRGFYHHRFRDVVQKPYIDFLGTPDGQNILRDAPPDHYHHHGLMFAIRVNGVNFWEEHTDGYPGKQQLVATKGVRTEMQCGPNGTFLNESLELNWISPRGTLLLEERRLIRARMKSESEPTLLTWVSALTRPDDREQAGILPDVVPPPHSAEWDDKIFLHGSSYNGFGLRFDESMDFGGRFFYSDDSDEMPIDGFELHQNVRCRWVAYTAKLHGQPVTVALVDLGSGVTTKDALISTPVSFKTETDIPEHPWDMPWIKKLPMVVYALNDPVEQRTNAYLSATANIFREPLDLDGDQAVIFRYGLAVWNGERTPQEVEKMLQAWEHSRNAGKL